MIIFVLEISVANYRHQYIKMNLKRMKICQYSLNLLIGHTQFFFWRNWHTHLIIFIGIDDIVFKNKKLVVSGLFTQRTSITSKQQVLCCSYSRNPRRFKLLWVFFWQEIQNRMGMLSSVYFWVYAKLFM